MRFDEAFWATSVAAASRRNQARSQKSAMGRGSFTGEWGLCPQHSKLLYIFGKINDNLGSFWQKLIRLKRGKKLAVQKHDYTS